MSSSYEEMMESKNFLPFRLDHLTSQMIEKAREELNEDENTRSSSIEQLRKVIIGEKNLKCRMDDKFLLQFLRARKFDVKKAFERLHTLYQVLYVTFPDVYANVDAERATKAFVSGFGSFLPYRDREGAAVLVAKISNWKPEDNDIYSILNCSAALTLSAVDYPATQVCGLHVLIDCKGTTLRHVASFRPRFLYLTSKALQDTVPVRYKSVHLINASAIFRYIWGIINFFLSAKMRNRVHFHDSMKSLHKFIPKEILPAEYGGDNPNFDSIEQGSLELGKFQQKYLQIIHGGYMKS